MSKDRQAHQKSQTTMPILPKEPAPVAQMENEPATVHLDQADQLVGLPDHPAAREFNVI